MKSEWKAFSALAVEWLGVPVEAMPFYSSSALLRWRARVILSFVLETGSFGHKKDVSYMKRYPYVIGKAISLWRHTWVFFGRCFFPVGFCAGVEGRRLWGGGEGGEVRLICGRRFVF